MMHIFSIGIKGHEFELQAENFAITRYKAQALFALMF
jgi:hypothetical protein